MQIFHNKKGDEDSGGVLPFTGNLILAFLLLLVLLGILVFVFKDNIINAAERLFSWL